MQIKAAAKLAPRGALITDFIVLCGRWILERNHPILSPVDPSPSSALITASYTLGVRRGAERFFALCVCSFATRALYFIGIEMRVMILQGWDYFVVPLRLRNNVKEGTISIDE